MKTNLESELEICPFLKKQCQADDEQIENYCVLNYDNCLEYRKYKSEIEKRRYEKRKR